MSCDVKTIPEILKYRSEHEGDAKCFSFYNKHGLATVINSQELYTLAGRFARCLRDWGFKSGDVIANGLPNSPERLITDFGIIMNSCIVTNLQVVEKDGSNVWNMAQLSGCKALIIPNRKKNAAHRIVSPFLPDNSTKHGIYDVTIEQAPSIKRVILCDRKDGDTDNSLIESLRNNNSEVLEDDCSPSSLAILLATSGSSGFSKLVPASHERILEMGRRFPGSNQNLVYSDRPAGWIGGFPFDYLAHGSKRALQDQFDDLHGVSAEAIWTTMSSAGCTGASLLPNNVYEIVDYVRQNPTDYKLHFISTGGQPIKEELMEALGLICHALVVSYGSTEGGVMAFGVITDPTHFKDFYCGKVMDDAQMKIVDEDGEEVKPGEDGEIYLKHSHITKEYYNVSSNIPSPSQSDMFNADGWFMTGDRGVLQQDRTLACFGRKGDVISFGATLVYLSWPESILNKHPVVQLSCVVGLEADEDVDDDTIVNDQSKDSQIPPQDVPKTGRVRRYMSRSASIVRNPELYAFVVPKERNVSETEIVSYFNSEVKDSGLGMELSGVWFLDTLPQLPSGKVNKRSLKDTLRQKLREAKSK